MKKTLLKQIALKATLTAALVLPGLASAQPTAGGITSSVTNGQVPLTVIFSNSPAASGSITNWVWNFGDGTILTETNAFTTITNDYTYAGTYSVTLTVYGPGGSNTATLANNIVVAPATPVFTYNSAGDVLAGFRKATGEAYEMVADLGSISNFLNLPAATTMSVTNYSTNQLNDTFADGDGNLQWSVFSSAPGALATAQGTFANGTIWFTLAAPDVNTQSAAPTRESNLTGIGGEMQSVGSGAVSVSATLGGSNADNTPYVVREPVTTNSPILTAYIDDLLYPAIGDFGGGGSPLPFSVENVTSNSFVAAQRSDLYEMSPASGGRNRYVDPLTGQTNGAAYFVGYFLLYPDGSMTFTRVPVVISAITSTTTNGEVPLTVVFSDSASGNITNWVWNFGDGTIVTNTTGSSVTNTYTYAGSYSVTLTVTGPSGTYTRTVVNDIVVAPATPVFTYNSAGDVLAGFRKATGEAYEMVADLGSISNFLNLPAATTMSVTNYSTNQLNDTFADGDGNLQWSVFSSAPGALATAQGTFANGTIWFTLAAPDVNTQSAAPTRESNLTGIGGEMQSVGGGAVSVSATLGGSNADNTPYVVREPVTTNSPILTTYIDDLLYPAIGDFGGGGSPLPFSVENVTSNSFVAAQRSDLYEMSPASGGRNRYVDPLTGQTNGAAYFVGYFLLYPDGSMTFTRVPVVISAITSTTTNGEVPLTVVFSDSASGNITNWVWNFGDGTIVTNTTGSSVTNTYTYAGSYSVTLTVTGPSGTYTRTVVNDIVVAPATPVFTYNSAGDVLAGFRKATGEAYEMVADLGSISNFLNLPAATTMSVTNYSTNQLNDTFADGDGNLQWSVFSSAPGALATAQGTFANGTIWFTLAAPDVNTQSAAPTRESNLTGIGGEMQSVGSGAVSVSATLGGSNADNTPYVVREPVTTNSPILTTYIDDLLYPAIGDFGGGGSPLPFSVENVTSNSFVAAQRSDLYEMSPASGGRNRYVDPLTGQTNGAAYFVGYFLLYPDGSMTFTRGPEIGAITGVPTSGETPLTVVFSDSASGNITNWVWNFGDGTIVTNTTGSSVINTYARGGSYTVTLTVTGPGGSNTRTIASYIDAISVPVINSSIILPNGNYELSGTNGTAGTEYRILTSTDLTVPIPSWTPVATNMFLGDGSFSFITSPTNAASFFEIVTP